MDKFDVYSELLRRRCSDFVTEQSKGEWSAEDIEEDAAKLFEFVAEQILLFAKLQ